MASPKSREPNLSPNKTHIASYSSIKLKSVKIQEKVTKCSVRERRRIFDTKPDITESLKPGGSSDSLSKKSTVPSTSTIISAKSDQSSKSTVTKTISDPRSTFTYRFPEIHKNQSENVKTETSPLVSRREDTFPQPSIAIEKPEEIQKQPETNEPEYVPKSSHFIDNPLLVASVNNPGDTSPYIVCEESESSADRTAEKIIWWVQTKLDVSNLEEMLKLVSHLNQNESEYQSVLTLHQILKSFTVELLNTYDNYVCFHGEHDEARMHKFLQAAFKRAENAWLSSCLITNGFSLEILQKAKARLFENYEGQNKEIILREEVAAADIAETIRSEYIKRLSDYLQEIDGKCQRRDFDALHTKMMTHCIGIMGRSLDYLGKFNNVAHEATRSLKQSLKDEMKLQAKNILFLPEDMESSPVPEVEVEEYILTEADEKKAALLDKCDRMERQLETGRVSVGKFTKKIILRAITQGRLAAAENMVDSPEARYIDELFELNNFK